MKLEKAKVGEYLGVNKYFKGDTEDVVFLDNSTAITLDKKDNFSKYKLVRKYLNVGESRYSYYTESLVSNSALCILALSYVVERVGKADAQMYWFLTALLDIEREYENDEEIYNELKMYDGDILDFLLSKSAIISNMNDYDVYKGIIERVIKK